MASVSALAHTHPRSTHLFPRKQYASAETMCGTRISMAFSTANRLLGRYPVALRLDLKWRKPTYVLTVRYQRQLEETSANDYRFCRASTPVQRQVCEISGFGLELQSKG